FCVFFVFYFYDATPNRHSFPTRRSSDQTDARDVVVHVRRQERLQHAVLTQPDVRGTERPELVGEQARQVPLTLRAGDAVDAFTGGGVDLDVAQETVDDGHPSIVARRRQS